ncbi:MAG: rhodanese-like domain-containing protein [Luteolibacter sp.]|nr:rhodanese-like domain-containing protein [Luteolibacter sp.]
MQTLTEPAPGKLSSISMEDFFLLHESGKTLLFDARPSLIYRMGHIPGAINLPKSRCDERIAVRGAQIRGALAAGKTIVVYCTGITCPDAHTVAMRLSSSGHPASVFSGGWDSWKEAGMPVE